MFTIRKYTKALNLFSLITVLTFVDGQDFGYDGIKGPSHWGEQYNTCFGKFQSPIDINSLMVKRIRLPPLEFHEFDISLSHTIIKNNGHTVMIAIETDNRPTISGGPLKGTYEFAQLHFHWGENDTMGSEDLIDGHSFPMELHMVFYKKQYRNIRSAMENSDGLAVLAFFFHLNDKDNPNYIKITELLPSVSEPDSSNTFTGLKSMKDLILPTLDKYYTYHGSLTTPPCSEVVTWIDFTESIPLSHAQIQLFRTIQDDEGHHLTHNFRPIQPLGDRDVYFVTLSNDEDDLLDKNLLAADKSLQDLSKFDSVHEKNTISKTTLLTDSDRIEPVQEQNNSIFETTSIRHKKFMKLGRNNATLTSPTHYWVIISFLSWIVNW